MVIWSYDWMLFIPGPAQRRMISAPMLRSQRSQKRTVRMACGRQSGPRNEWNDCSFDLEPSKKHLALSSERDFTDINGLYSLCLSQGYILFARSWVDLDINCTSTHHTGYQSKILQLQLPSWLVVGPPLWKIWESMGMISFPYSWENTIHGNQTTNQPGTFRGTT